MTFHLIIDNQEVHGSLVSFCSQKLSNFQDPERKGTPKGDPIGFGRDKYHCALLSLTNLSLIEISEKVGVSYGVLRKWNHEQDFKDQVNNFVREFTKELSGLMNRRQIHSQSVEDRFYYGDKVKQELLDFFKQKVRSKDGLDLADIHYYLMLFEERGKGGMNKRGVNKDGNIGKSLREVLRETDRMVFNRLVEMGEKKLRQEKLDQQGKQEVTKIFSYLRRIYRPRELKA
jgi:hypothetical protein